VPLEQPNESSTRGTVDTPEWKTFEDVEAYATGNAVGLLGRLLPDRVWEYLFSPTSLGRQKVRKHRNLVKEDYSSVQTAYRSALDCLSTKCESVPKEQEWKPRLVEKYDQQWFPASGKPREECETLGEYITNINEAVEHEQRVTETAENISSRPEAAFLRKDERSTISEIEQVLTHSVTAGKSEQRAAKQAREDVITQLESKRPEWERKLTQIREAATPYLSLEEYLSSDELLQEIGSLEEQLQSTRRSDTFNLDVIPDDDWIQQLLERLSTLRDDLEKSREEYAEAQLTQIKQSAQDSINTLETQLRGAKKRGETIEEPDTLLSEIESRQDEIEELREAVYWSQLADARVASLSKLETELTEYAEFINKKVTFDEQLKKYTAQLRKLRVDASPYLAYEEYLAQPVNKKLSSQISELNSDLGEFKYKLPVARLSRTDREEFSSLQDDVQSIERHLEDYNPEFVKRQRQKCAPLFSDIGVKNLDLTAEQERAVIRNGVYNQVIAAAGTGKTLTLTTRVAYLVEQQDIDPDRILVVTYMDEAMEEMKTRLKDHFGITEVEIRTVHSFGYSIIQDAQDEYVEAAGGHECKNYIDRQLQEMRDGESSELLDHYYEFLVHFNDVYYDEADFETRKEYVEARVEQEYKTLKGEQVKSRAEKLIADFLYTHQIEYRYEDRATWAETATDKAGYSPDFYLPESDVYIEHWGIDESGSIAPWFSWSSNKYRKKMQWARSQFADSEYELVDTYEFEHEATRLKQALRHRLSRQGIELNRMSFNELVNSAFEYNQREGWIKGQFESFIENAKRFNLKPAEIESNLDAANPRQYHFGKCGIHLLQQYELYLTRNRLISFSDMIQNAVDLIRQSPQLYKSSYDHLLVDEFQDIGEGKLELVQELTGQDGAKLFAVGDDWQSILSFQGANIDYFIRFASHFGVPVRTDLTENFRCPPEVVNTGNRLIEENSRQLNKTVQAAVDQGFPPRVHPLRGYRFYDYVRRVRQYTLNLVNEYIDGGADPGEIMVLCRFDHAVPYLTEIKNGLKSQNIPYIGKSDTYRGPSGQADDGVSVYSVYQSKGREAKHVILVHIAEGKFGFPPERREDELLNPVQPISLGGLEEERRAFYVAVTRTKHTLDLLTRGEQESRFLDEIEACINRVETGKVQPLEEVGELMNVTAKVSKILDPWRKQHQRGILSDRYGGSARFVSWESADPPSLQEEEWYSLDGIKVSEYKDEKELVITEGSSIRHLPEKPEVGGRIPQ